MTESRSDWRADYAPLRTIVERGGVGLLACRRRSDGANRVLVIADGARLDAIEEAHRRIASPQIAAVESRGPAENDYLVLHSNAVLSLEDIVDELAEGGKRVPYAEGIALNELIMDTLEAAHHAFGGEPAGCFGAFCAGNLATSLQGDVWLFGAGHNFPAAVAAGTRGRSAGWAQAPELAFHLAPSPAADVFALHAFARQLLAVTDPLPVFGRVFGQVDTEPLERIHAALLALSNDLSAPDPKIRPQSVADLRRRYREIRALSEDMPPADFEGLRETLAAAARRLSGPLLHVNDDGREVVLPDGTSLDLSRRRSLRLVLRCLVETHRSRPGAAVSADDLLAAGWPGERVVGDAGRARVYVAISTLRKMGLEDVIARRDDGYALNPDVRVAG